MTPGNNSTLGIYRATAENLKLKMLLYGNPGAGKTTLALTANDHPELSPALLLNFEGGLLSVVGRGDVDAIDIVTTDELERVFWYLRESNPEVDKFKTIIVDSGSELYSKALREVVTQNMGRRQNRKGDEDDFELEDYGKAGNVIGRLFSMFRDLPRHVIVTSHAKFVYPPNADPAKNPNLEPKEVRPNFSASLANRLTGQFDFVHYLYTADQVVQIDDETQQVVPHRYLLTRGMGAYQAKTRGPSFATALGDIVVDPTLPMLYDLLLQTEGGQPQPKDHYPESDPDGDARWHNALSDPLPTVLPDLTPEAVEAELEEVTA
jgi:hypothetical protein